MSDVDDRQPPSDVNAEQCVLGACMMSTKALDDAAGLVIADDFYLPRHGELFAAMLTMRETGLAVDPVSLGHHMGNRLIAVGGLPFIHDLMAAPPTASNVAYHCEIVTAMATRRRLSMAGQRVSQLAHDKSQDPEDIVESARGLLDDVAHVTRRNVDVEEIGNASKLVLAELAEPEQSALSTGWRRLDDLHLGGLRPGTLTIVGARPSVGKSVIVGDMALDAALHGHGALFISLEMTRTELICRMLSNLASVPLSRLLRHQLGGYDGEDWKRVQKAHDRLDGIPLGMTQNPYLGLTSIRSLARDRARTARGLRLIVVDYLGLINPADKKQDRRIQVDAISRGLKLMAKELEVAVVAACQLNRGPEQRVDKRPSLADLRESGSIEQDADNVWLLYREPEDPADPTAGREIEVIVAKNRQGPTGSVQLEWVPEYCRAVSQASGF
jgi:replicative DNA helicase